MRNKIQQKLLEVDENIFYGIVPDNKEINDWNYLVFGQTKLRKSGTSLNDLNGYWYVTIVRENFIPDDDVFEVIDKLTGDKGIPGLRLADGDYEYTYLLKGDSNIVVEILELQFTKTKKADK